MEWHEEHAERWNIEQQVASTYMADVCVGIDQQQRAFLVGSVSLRSGHGHLRDTVRVRIVYPPRFPDRGRFPSVYLESHREQWKNISGSHIEADWRLCLFVPGESGIDFGHKDSLVHLLECLRTFLFKEVVYQRDLRMEAVTGKPPVWPGKARSHGVAGIKEMVTDQGGVGRNAPCPCGSGKKFKHCHMTILEG